MYEEYLGFGYHEKVRDMLSVDENLLPDSIIDSDINIGAMKILSSPLADDIIKKKDIVNLEEEYSKLVDVALHYLCGVLCIALKSRTANGQFNDPKYMRDWDNECAKFVNYANEKSFPGILSTAKHLQGRRGF